MDTPSSGGGGCRLTRQRSSRLQMHAPSSLKVVQSDVARWNAAIPLLSPLDTATEMAPAPRAWDAAEREERRQPARAAAATAAVGKRGEPAAAAAAWKHPAAPFYYEPAPPGSGPAFLLNST